MSARPRAPSRAVDASVKEYPVSDGQPMAETPIHRVNMTNTIATLERRFADVEDVYISGNMFVYYVEGNRRCLAPDTFLVFDVPRRDRDAYFTWLEPKPNLDFVAEFTSRSTRGEDVDDKYRLYQDELGVQEYLLFDPYKEYLDPPEQLYRLTRGTRGKYRRVRRVAGRLPSKVLGLHIDRDGRLMRLYDPQAGAWLPTPGELAAERDEVIAERDEVAEERDEVAAERDEALLRLADSTEELERLRSELERLKRGATRNNNKNNHRGRG